MDPQAALAELIDAAVAGDWEEMLDHAQDLADWLDRGGARPLDPRKDPRHGNPVGENEIAGLVVAFKALVHRGGDSVEFSNEELEHARTLHARVDATPERMTVEMVDGPPPDVPRFDTTA